MSPLVRLDPSHSTNRHKEGDCSGTGCFRNNSPSARPQPGGTALLFPQLQETQTPQPSPATWG